VDDYEGERPVNPISHLVSPLDDTERSTLRTLVCADRPLDAGILATRVNDRRLHRIDPVTVEASLAALVVAGLAVEAPHVDWRGATSVCSATEAGEKLLWGEV
jgi:hypothetical protein